MKAAFIGLLVSVALLCGFILGLIVGVTFR